MVTTVKRSKKNHCIVCGEWLLKPFGMPYAQVSVVCSLKCNEKASGKSA